MMNEESTGIQITFAEKNTRALAVNKYIGDFFIQLLHSLLWIDNIVNLQMDEVVIRGDWQKNSDGALYLAGVTKHSYDCQTIQISEKLSDIESFFHQGAFDYLAKEAAKKVIKIALPYVIKHFGVQHWDCDRECPPGISYTEHRLDICKALDQIQYNTTIENPHRRLNYLIVGQRMVSELERTPLFSLSHWWQDYKPFQVGKYAHMTVYSLFLEPEDFIFGYAGKDGVDAPFTLAIHSLEWQNNTVVLNYGIVE